MFSSYRALLARAGARPLVLACGLAWISFTGYVLAIILAVHAATSSFAVAGGVVASFSAASALGAPVRGRFLDRLAPAGWDCSRSPMGGSRLCSSWVVPSEQIPCCYLSLAPWRARSLRH